MNKSIKLFICTFLISFISKAQILDSITFDQFKTLTYEDLNLSFEDNFEALSIIKKNRTKNRLAIPLFLLPYSTPAVIATLINNKKINLYTKLIACENEKVLAKTNNRNLVMAHLKNKKFDLTFEEFKSMSKTEQKLNFIYDYNTAFIFDYSYNFELIEAYSYAYTYINSVFLLYFACLSPFIYFSGRSTDEVGIILLAMTLGSTILNLAGLPVFLHYKTKSSTKTVYKNLHNYYNNGLITDDLQKYIDKEKSKLKNY